MAKKPNSGKDDAKPLTNAQVKKIVTNSNPYELPPNIIQILNEHSCGFVLATLDHNGNFNFTCKHDNEIIGQATELRLLKMLEIRQNIMEAQNEHSMLKGMGMIDEDDGD